MLCVLCFGFCVEFVGVDDDALMLAFADEAALVLCLHVEAQLSAVDGGQSGGGGDFHARELLPHGSR